MRSVDRQEIVVAAPQRVGSSTVRYHLRCAPGLRRYLPPQSLFVDYDDDLASLPDSILLIPLLATILPIAWVLDARVTVPCIDQTFSDSLGELKAAFRVIHPRIDWGGDVVADRVDTNGGTSPGSRRIVLFSGGVDSLATFLRHRAEKPILVSVWGADVGLSQGCTWERVAARTREFADKQSVQVNFIRTNFRTFFNSFVLREKFFPEFQNWYSAIQQGWGLLGICAPLSFLHDAGVVYISSTHAPAYSTTWGTHPEIDNKVKWGATVGHHDAFELTRQDKIRMLALHIKEEDPTLQLRVCWGGDTNCSRCHKCDLTMVGRARAGVDPNRHGFSFVGAALAGLRRRLERGAFSFGPTYLERWKDLQENVRKRSKLELAGLGVNGAEDFFAWFQDAPLDRFKDRARPSMLAAFKAKLRTWPEPTGRLFRRLIGFPFP